MFFVAKDWVELHPYLLTPPPRSPLKKDIPINTHDVRCILDLIIKGTIPRVPDFFLWYLWNVQLHLPEGSTLAGEFPRGEIHHGQKTSAMRYIFNTLT